MVLVMLTHHGAHGKLKLFHLEDGGFNHQRDYKKIQRAVEAEASPDSFKELKQEMEKFSTEFREAFTSNEKINNLIKNRFKQEVINEAVPFSELIDGQAAQMNMGAKNIKI